MYLTFVTLTVGFLASPIQMTLSDDFEKELAFLKTKIENLENNDADLKKKNEQMEDIMKENEVTLRNKISNMEKNENSLRNKVYDMENNEIIMRKNFLNMKNTLANLDLKCKTSTNEEGVNILHKINNNEVQDDCCDFLTNEVNNIKNSMGHLIDIQNANSKNIVENQLKIQANEEQIQANKEQIQASEEQIQENEEQIDTNLVDMMQRSSFCAFRHHWYDNKNELTITYDNLFVDDNNIADASFNIKKGKFIAGLKGVYKVDFSVGYMDISAMDDILTVIWLRINGVNLEESCMHEETPHDDGNFGGRSLMVNMEKGDTLEAWGEAISDVYRISFCISLVK